MSRAHEVHDENGHLASLGQTLLFSYTAEATGRSFQALDTWPSDNELQSTWCTHPSAAISLTHVVSCGSVMASRDAARGTFPCSSFCRSSRDARERNRRHSRPDPSAATEKLIKIDYSEGSPQGNFCDFRAKSAEQKTAPVSGQSLLPFVERSNAPIFPSLE